MNYSKQLLAIALLFTPIAFGMQGKPSIAVTIRKPRTEAEPSYVAGLTGEKRDLFLAISKDNADEVRKVLASSPNAKILANALDSKNWTALMRAVGDDKLVKILLEFGADPNGVSDRGVHSLREAAAGNHPESIRLLLKAGANVNLADKSGITPLMIAVSQGSPEGTKILIDAGADVNAQDKSNTNVMYWAEHSKMTKEQSAQIIQWLKEKGAKPSIKNGVKQ